MHIQLLATSVLVTLSLMFVYSVISVSMVLQSHYPNWETIVDSVRANCYQHFIIFNFVISHNLEQFSDVCHGHVIFLWPCYRTK